MLQLLISFANLLVGFVFKKAVIKFLVITAIFLVVEELSKVLLTYIPSLTGLNQYFALIPNDLWYFLDLMAFSTGFPMILAAYATAFLIRRLPVIG